VDLGEKDRILAHADLVREAMDPDQDSDSTRWFEDNETADPDFPSGRAIGTSALGGACVFLDGAKRCVLQKATLAAKRPGFDLKPFFCTAFPIVIFEGILTLDEEDSPNHPRCCKSVPDGPRTVLDVFPMELAHVLGPEGLEELRGLFRMWSEGGARP
jgi:hypothetical protein